MNVHASVPEGVERLNPGELRTMNAWWRAANYLSVGQIYLLDNPMLLWVADHCLRSWDRINVIVAGKQPEPQWLDMDSAIKHCERGLGIWEFASNDRGGEPDVVMACAGDVPTLECIAAVDLLRRHVPDLKVRVINVVDLMTLQPKSDHPHGLDDADFDAPSSRRTSP